MKEYYNKPELTARVKINGWIHTGDLAEIDEDGFVYIWGRVKDAVTLFNGRQIYLFDIAHKMMQKSYIDDAIVLQIPGNDNLVNVVAHIVWDKSVMDSSKAAFLIELNDLVKRCEPEINLRAYAFHEGMLPYSPTTLKKDKNKMSKQKDRFVQVIDGELKRVQL